MMNLGSKLLATIFLSTAVLFVSAAQAMPIWQFDKMAQEDRSEYVGVLIQGAEKVLTDEGKTDQAKKVENLFTTNGPDGQVSIGMGEFMINLARLRLADAKRALADPHATRLEVEHAMALTLKQNDIVLPKSFMHVGHNFHSKSSLFTQNPDGTITVQRRPPTGDGQDANVKKGLVIPAQVIAPFIPIPEKK